MSFLAVVLFTAQLYMGLAIIDNGHGRFIISNLPSNSITIQMVELSISPFYQNEKLITNLVRIMLDHGDAKTIFHLLQNVIEIEKAWRMKLCIRVFGTKSCTCEMSSEAFYLWKKTFVHHLQQDPTEEITNRIWSNLQSE